MKYTVRPISDRTAFTGEHKNSPFGITHSQLMDEFDRELWFLDAKNVVLEVDVEERHIRNDGMLRADAKTRTPGVRLCFDSNQGPLAYATDAFTKPTWKRNVMAHDWQHNLCAIVRGLEALRKVDRYGITKRGEQYAGWKQLGAGTAMPASHMTHDRAVAILASYVNIPPQHLNLDPSSLRSTWRRARRDAHPDRNAGDQTKWDQVEQAARVLGVTQ